MGMQEWSCYLLLVFLLEMERQLFVVPVLCYVDPVYKSRHCIEYPRGS
jgi:hypothetical protein